MRLGGLWRCCSAVLPSTAHMCTWASVRPAMRVRPRRSTVSTLPRRGPTLPDRMTSLMRSPSTTTAAPSTGSLPVPSMRKALVRTVRGTRAPLSLHDLGFVHPHLLVGAGLPVDPIGHAVEIVLLPEKDPRDLGGHHLLDLRPRLQPLLGIHDGDGGGDLVLEGLVASVRRVGHGALEELLDRALRVEGGTPPEEEHVTRLAVLDLVEVSAPLVDHHVDGDADTAELGGDGLRDVLVERVAARGRVEGQGETARIDIGRLQQDLRVLDVVLEALDLGGEVYVDGRQRAAHLGGPAPQHLLDQLVHIDGLADGLAHPDILHPPRAEIDEGRSE